MLCYGIIVLRVLCVIGVAYSISNVPVAPTTGSQDPVRRFYFYNPEILPHAAAALGMVLPQPYRPMPISPLQFAQYGGGEEEEEELEEHEHKIPNNLQIFALLKPQKQGKQKKKKKQGKQPFKKLKKFAKKCLPFKLRIIKKSDMNINDRNYQNYAPYGYRNEYFPNQDLTLISFNTSGLTSNGNPLPEILQFVYPQYPNRPKTRRVLPPKKRYALPKRHYGMGLRRPWPRRNPWRVAPPGKPISEFPLKEPNPKTVGGSPPPSPLFNYYQDSRIPVNQMHVEKQTVASVPKVSGYTPVQITSSTEAAQYYDEQYWNKLDPNEKYSDPDYYRYGTYNQIEVPQGNVNQDQEDTYPDQNYVTSERVVTVTPTTAWVPIPQLHRLNEADHSKIKRTNSFKSENTKQIQQMSGGFKNLSANAETTSSSYNFGEKLIASKCNSPNKCQALEGSTKKRIVNRKGNYKYHNKQESTTVKYHSRKRNDLLPKGSTNSDFYIEEIMHVDKGNENNNKMEIVTAVYPQDNFNIIYVSSNKSSSVRARRSDFGGFSAVVSGSMRVKQK